MVAVDKKWKKECLYFYASLKEWDPLHIAFYRKKKSKCFLGILIVKSNWQIPDWGRQAKGFGTVIIPAWGPLQYHMSYMVSLNKEIMWETFSSVLFLWLLSVCSPNYPFSQSYMLVGAALRVCVLSIVTYDWRLMKYSIK